MGGVDRSHVDHRRRQQSLDIGHGVDEALLLARVELAQVGLGQGVARLLDRLALGQAGGSEARGADAPVEPPGDELDHAVGLQRGKEVAGPIRVDAQARSQGAHLAPVRADLVQEARLGERAVTRETAVIELGHALHDRAIEPPDLFHASRVDAELWAEIVC
jgi:hypothetical protein